MRQDRVIEELFTLKHRILIVPKMSKGIADKVFQRLIGLLGCHAKPEWLQITKVV